MWRSSGPSPVIGQHVCPVMPSPAPDTDTPAAAAEHYPVAVYAEHRDRVEHDFTQLPFVTVEVRLRLASASDARGGGVLVQYRAEEAEAGTRWTGPLGQYCFGNKCSE